MRIGAHVSIAGGLPRGIERATRLRCECIQIFYGSPRQWRQIAYPAEMREAFGWTPDRFIYFGGCPGAAALTSDRERWARYILDSIIETTVSRDILLMTRVDKPALLRQALPARVPALGADPLLHEDARPAS